MTSFVSGFVIFSVLGYMACRSGRDIGDMNAEGTSLVFIVYPEALSTLPFAPLFSFIFFMMLMTLGLDSSVSALSAFFTNTVWRLRSNYHGHIRRISGSAQETRNIYRYSLLLLLCDRYLRVPGCECITVGHD